MIFVIFTAYAACQVFWESKAVSLTIWLFTILLSYGLCHEALDFLVFRHSLPQHN